MSPIHARSQLTAAVLQRRHLGRAQHIATGQNQLTHLLQARGHRSRLAVDVLLDLLERVDLIAQLVNGFTWTADSGDFLLNLDNPLDQTGQVVLAQVELFDDRLLKGEAKRVAGERRNVPRTSWMISIGVAERRAD